MEKDLQFTHNVTKINMIFRRFEIKKFLTEFYLFACNKQIRNDVKPAYHWSIEMYTGLSLLI